VYPYSLPNEAEWRREGLELTKISVLRCEQIVRTLESGPPLQLIDVRSRAEWLSLEIHLARPVPAVTGFSRFVLNAGTFLFGGKF
jgi:hypothetical protein